MLQGKQSDEVRSFASMALVNVPSVRMKDIKTDRLREIVRRIMDIYRRAATAGAADVLPGG